VSDASLVLVSSHSQKHVSRRRGHPAQHEINALPLRSYNSSKLFLAVQNEKLNKLIYYKKIYIIATNLNSPIKFKTS